MSDLTYSTTNCKKLNIFVSGFKTWRANTTDSSILEAWNKNIFSVA